MLTHMNRWMFAHTFLFYSLYFPINQWNLCLQHRYIYASVFKVRMYYVFEKEGWQNSREKLLGLLYHCGNGLEWKLYSWLLCECDFKSLVSFPNSGIIFYVRIVFLKLTCVCTILVVSCKINFFNLVSTFFF